MYNAIELFGFKGTIYKPGDIFPVSDDIEVTEEEYTNLTTDSNGLGKPLIAMKPLSEFNVTQLREMAKAQEIEGYSKLKKEELIEALTEDGE